MKSFVFITILACLFQAYHFAPVSDASDPSLLEFRSSLADMPSFDVKTIDNVLTVLKDYENDPVNTSVLFPLLSEKLYNKNLEKFGLLTLALQQDTCTKNRIDLKRILETAFTSNVEEKLAKKDAEPNLSNLLITENELKVIENELSKTLTPEKVQDAIKLLRGFRKDNSGEQLGAAAINMMFAAAKGLSDGCPSEKTENSANE